MFEFANKQLKKETMKLKTITKATLGLFVLGVSGWMLTAQDSGEGAPNEQGPGPREGGPAGPGPRRLPPPPLFVVLDANHDGIIDETEIANASVALRTLDKNGDGKLTRDELAPPRPPRGEGRRFQPGPPPQGPDGQPGAADNR